MRILNVLLLCLLPLQGCKAEGISIEDREIFSSTIEKAQSIIVALDNFLEDNNDYPGKLEDLVPLYIEAIPEPDIGKGFRYLNPSSYIGYNGPKVYSLIFIPDEPSFFGDSSTYFLYSSDGNYKKTEKREVHFIVDDWAYVTAHTNAIGEGGRIE